MWSRCAVVVTLPDATTLPNALSCATSQRTAVGSPRPEPGVARAWGVTRVHRITRSGSGSPEATECAKTPEPPGAAAADGITADATAAVPAATVADFRNVLRVTCDICEDCANCGVCVNCEGSGLLTDFGSL
ncbi:Uncharacterised protein [Mycobacteroides abscessus subsp. abscessus]|nr:Uncharacterised protein [Mycobacteroides abscessus subsp. abscessus]